MNSFVHPADPPASSVASAGVRPALRCLFREYRDFRRQRLQALSITLCARNIRRRHRRVIHFAHDIKRHLAIIDLHDGIPASRATDKFYLTFFHLFVITVGITHCLFYIVL